MPKASNGNTIDALRRRGVTRATFHPDGRLASFELGPLPPIVKVATRGKAGTVTHLVREEQPRAPDRQEDLDALDDVPPAYERGQ